MTYNISADGIGYLIKSLNDKLKSDADADLKEFNLTFSQTRILAYLRSCGGKATQKEIEIFSAASHPTVVGIISRMEQNGYVETFFDAFDKRNKIVKLTKLASALGEDMEKRILEKDKKLMSSLSENEIAELKRMLCIILKNF